MEEKSLYERLGGVVPIATAAGKVIDASFSNVVANKNPNVHAFHMDETYRQAHKFMLTAWLVEKTGGPKCYIGRTMRETHKNLAITNAQFTAVRADVVAILAELGVPDSEKQEILVLLDHYRADVVRA